MRIRARDRSVAEEVEFKGGLEARVYFIFDNTVSRAMIIHKRLIRIL